MSFQSGQVKQVIRTYAVEIQTSDKRELDADAVTMKLRKAMGANCNIPVLMPRIVADFKQTTDKVQATEFKTLFCIRPTVYWCRPDQSRRRLEMVNYPRPRS